MDKNEFLELYKNYKPSDRTFDTNEWNDALAEWKKYFDLIIDANGFPFDRWIKNDAGYLPDFLDVKEQKFGHARIGNYTQVMIYKYTGKDKNRLNKIYNGYKNKGEYFEKEDDVKEDYENNIQSLLSEISKIFDTTGLEHLSEADQYNRQLERIYDIEKPKTKYDNFVCKQILRKMIVLMTLAKGKNTFVWIYSEKTLKKLFNILEQNYQSSKTFLENNKIIYDIAKDWAGIDENSSKDDIVKLYDFLWYLTDKPNINELITFSHINIIFNGAPGTGKTYSVTKCIEALRNLNKGMYKNSKYIQFHPSFSYQDFIEGIKPMGMNAGNVDLKVVNGSFKEFCIFVKEENEKFYKSLTKKPDPKKPSTFKNWPHYYFVVDEINRGNLSNIFGETFTLLEGDYRDYDFCGTYDEISSNLVSTALSNVIAKLSDNKLIYKKINDNVYFGIPFNIHFIGMMNDVDRSIDAFDLALRRRFKWIQMNCDYEVLRKLLEEHGFPNDDIDDYVKSCENLNKYICDGESEGLKLGSLYQIGHAFFLKIRGINNGKTITDSKIKEVFDNYISGTLKEYIRQLYDENQVDTCMKKAKEVFGAK